MLYREVVRNILYAIQGGGNKYTLCYTGRWYEIYFMLYRELVRNILYAIQGGGNKYTLCYTGRW